MTTSPLTWCASILVASFCVLYTTSAHAQVPSPDPQELAFAAFQQGDHAALTALTRDATQAPARAYLFKALIEREHHTFEQSIHTFQEGLGHHPNHRDLMMELAVTYSWSDQAEQALTLYENLLVTTPTYLPARQGRARMLSWLGRHKEARVAYQVMLEEPEARQQALLGLGFLSRAQGRRRQATRYYSMALQADAQDQEAMRGLESVEAMTIGALSYQVGAVRLATGEMNMDMRTNVEVSAGARWRFSLGHTARSGTQAISYEAMRGGKQQLEFRAGRAIGRTRRHNLGVMVGHHFDTSAKVLGIEGSHRLDESITLLHGARHQTSTSQDPGRQVYRVGLSKTWSPTQLIILQSFVGTSAGSQLDVIALSGSHRVTLGEGRLQLDHALSPEWSPSYGAAAVAESTWRWNLATRPIALHMGIQAGVRYEPFVGIRTGVSWAF